MKKLVLISAIAMSSLFYNAASAQLRVHIGFNFGPRRVIVPAPVEYVEPVNYYGEEDYYYLPEVDAYYSIPQRCYFYNYNGSWVSAAYLPGAYHDFDWRYARRFEVRAPRPFMHHEYYRTRYNGVVFNGDWNHCYNNYAYAKEYRYRYDGYRRDDRRFDNDNRDRYYRRDNDNRDRHFDNYRDYNRDNHFDNRREDNRNRDNGNRGTESYSRNDNHNNHRGGIF